MKPMKLSMIPAGLALLTLMILGYIGPTPVPSLSPTPTPPIPAPAPAMANIPMVIAPYWYQGTWVFDDESVGLNKEPFVAGVPEIINELVKDIPNARSGFRLLFSSVPFPGYQIELTRVKEEYGGYWYRVKDQSAEGWLCPALFKYFETAPETIYVKAEQL